MTDWGSVASWITATTGVLAAAGGGMAAIIALRQLKLNNKIRAEAQASKVSATLTKDGLHLFNASNLPVTSVVLEFCGYYNAMKQWIPMTIVPLNAILPGTFFISPTEERRDDLAKLVPLLRQLHENATTQGIPKHLLQVSIHFVDSSGRAWFKSPDCMSEVEITSGMLSNERTARVLNRIADRFEPKVVLAFRWYHKIIGLFPSSSNSRKGVTTRRNML